MKTKRGAIMRLIMNCLIPFFLLFAACSPSKKESGSLTRQVRLNLESEPSTLDPRKARDLGSLTIARMLFEGLTRVGLQGKPELALADEYAVSEDCKTYTFHLRPALWSDGSRVTAGDFVRSWRRALSPDFPAETAFQLYVIRGAKRAKLGEISPEEIGV